MSEVAVAIQEFIDQFDMDVEAFEKACKESLRNRGDYLNVVFPYDVPLFLFEADAVDIFNDVESCRQEGFRGVLLNEFKNSIHELNKSYERAYELFEENGSEIHPLAVSVVDLFPVRIRNIDDPRRARYDALCVAYSWLHEVKNVKLMRDGLVLPDLFLTDDCIFLYSITVRGKIGKWLVDNKDLWV